MKSECNNAEVTCLNCWHRFKLKKIYLDDMGEFTVCPKCKASFDIDVDQETKNEFKKEKKYICLG